MFYRRILDEICRESLRGMSVFAGPCHHGMARPQVADGGAARDLEGSCE